MKGFGYQRPWVLINDMPSYGVDGLIITSLPPITKPKLRYSSEEIDGRDGDIITTLGYQAYDKTLSVGLHGNFDIDTVIDFFADQGHITFSNEPDKEYDFIQLESIDFDRLVRYRTADVKLHIQPYKRSRVHLPKVFDGSAEQAVVVNEGNVMSAPMYLIKGLGGLSLYLDGSQVVQISDIGNLEMAINVAKLEAYTPEGVLMNRYITGDYARLMLSPGKHTIQWSGDLGSLTIEYYSRWI